VDSSPLIVQRLEEMLSEVAIITAIYSSVCYENALKLYIEKRPGVVLLGISLQAFQPINLLAQIKKHNYKTQVIVLSIDGDEYTYEQCQLLGADHLLDKYRDFEKLPGIIHSISTSVKLIN